MFPVWTRPSIRRKQRKSPFGQRHLQKAAAAYQTRLRIEPLEERRLLAVFTVSNLFDSGTAACGRRF